MQLFYFTLSPLLPFTTPYCLGTTLINQNQYNNIQDFIDLYHARWGVEELYKVSKHIFCIEDFHAKSERGVKQEIYAHFALITMNRIFANKADADLNQPNYPAAGYKNSSREKQKHILKTNFKNCIQVFSRSMEELLLLQTKIKTSVERVYKFIIGRTQKERPGRSYTRKSMKPIAKWQPSKEKKKKTQILAA